MAATLKVTTQGDREILVTRVFDAPRELVFDAMSKPELVRRWCSGPEGWSMIVCEDEQRVGSEFRCVWRDPKGNELGMKGTYREIVPPERIVRTERFQMAGEEQGTEQIATLVLSEKDNKTTITLTLLFPSKEARDGAIASGMEGGVRAGYDRLAAFLAEESAATE